MTDPDVVDFAHRMLDLSRAGDAEQLLAYVDAGLPVDLADPGGNTLLMLGAYHGQVDVVVGLAALLDAGADLDAGTPSARETAAYFERDLGEA